VLKLSANIDIKFRDEKCVLLELVGGGAVKILFGNCGTHFEFWVLCKS
jgi:hypothetical protein